MSTGDSENPQRLDPRQTRGRRKLENNATADYVSRATRSDIIKVAKSEFTKFGFKGASVNRVAELSATSKRMIYYHFGSKRGLYVAVLEDAYLNLQGHQPASDSVPEDPMEELRTFAMAAFDVHINNIETIQLIMIENMNGARVLATLEKARIHSHKRLDVLEQIWKRGCALGVMRSDIRPIDLYTVIVGTGFYSISNQNSMKALFDIDLSHRDEINRRRVLIADLACRYVMV